MASSHDEKAQLEAHLLQHTAAARAGAVDSTRGHDIPLEAAGLDIAPDDDDLPPPVYGAEFGTIQQEKDGFGTSARVADDGRVNIRIDQRNRRLSHLLVPTLNQLQASAEYEPVPPPPYIPPSLGGEEGVPPPPPLNVVIQIVGSRGDVQPFVALAKVLKERYGHRVRLATHPNFKDFVSENGIEFFNIGGDPQSLMAFMVKNPGLMPGFDSLKAGDVGQRRKEIAEYLQGCWRSCYETGDGFGPPTGDEAVASSVHQPFVADCIIANPPSFAHAHVAEKLGIPLHIFFTMPYSPTQAFPHPLANIQDSNADANLTNYISYTLVDMLTWQGLGDVINRFRTKTLGLDEMSVMWAPGMLQRLKIPHTYAWSPALIPKPKDWGANVTIPGFFFLDLAKNYTPASDLKAFLDAGPPPVYIGFGSIVLDDPNGMTELIFEAVRRSGQRALVSKGWGGVGADQLGKPDDIFMLGNVPHDWLFKHVACVVHHGGAGTTSAGITAGRPTVVVPFFGDQPFWGAMIARAGAGPEPIPSKKLTADNLAEAIRTCMEPQMQGRAQDLAAKMAKENGSEVGAQNFHQFLDVDMLRCGVAPSRTAVWVHKRSHTRLSAMAACTLVQEGLLDYNDLKLFRPREYDPDQGPSDPLSGGATYLIGAFSTMMMGVADLPSDTVQMFKPRSDGKNKVGNSAGSGEAVPSGSTASPQSSGNPHATSRVSDAKRTDSVIEGTNGKASATMETSDNRKKMHASGSGSGGNKASKVAMGAGKGVNRIVGTSLRSPMDFSVNMAKGFRNAPKLYGDDTVRKSDKVTGWRSGLTAAGKEFGYGMYDGITGIVTQPYKGAAKEGGVGFLKGFGKGIGGFFFKPGAALFAIPGYSMQGVYKEMQKAFGSSVQNYVIAGRTAQGLDEYQRASPEEQQDVVMRWKALPKHGKTKNDPHQGPKGLADQKAKHTHGGPLHSIESKDQGSIEVGGSRSVDPMLSMGNPHGIQESTGVAQRAPVANAGTPQEKTYRPVDMKGRRSSIDDLEDEQLRRALAENAAEAERHQRQQAAHDEQLRSVMAQSMKISEYPTATYVHGESHVPQHPPTYDPGHLGGTTRAEFERQREKQPAEKSEAQLSREQVILEYVKEQSLLEEESRRNWSSGVRASGSGAGPAAHGDEHDEDLQRALKLSMQKAGRYD